MEKHELIELYVQKIMTVITPPANFVMPPAWAVLTHDALAKAMSDLFDVGVQTGKDENVTEKQLTAKNVVNLKDSLDADEYHGC